MLRDAVGSVHASPLLSVQPVPSARHQYWHTATDSLHWLQIASHWAMKSNMPAAKRPPVAAASGPNAGCRTRCRDVRATHLLVRSRQQGFRLRRFLDPLPRTRGSASFTRPRTKVGSWDRTHFSRSPTASIGARDCPSCSPTRRSRSSARGSTTPRRRAASWAWQASRARAGGVPAVVTQGRSRSMRKRGRPDPRRRAGDA